MRDIYQIHEYLMHAAAENQTYVHPRCVVERDSEIQLESAGWELVSCVI